jgi:hypothetical protein
MYRIQQETFIKFQEQNVGKKVELDDDVTYPVTRITTISFRIPLGDVPNLHDVIFVL